MGNFWKATNPIARHNETCQESASRSRSLPRKGKPGRLANTNLQALCNLVLWEKGRTYWLGISAEFFQGDLARKWSMDRPIVLLSVPLVFKKMAIDLKTTRKLIWNRVACETPDALGWCVHQQRSPLSWPAYDHLAGPAGHPQWATSRPQPPEAAFIDHDGKHVASPCVLGISHWIGWLANTLLQKKCCWLISCTKFWGICWIVYPITCEFNEPRVLQEWTAINNTICDTTYLWQKSLVMVQEKI